MKLKRHLNYLLTVICLCCAATAQAAIVVYTDFAAWEAAVLSPTSGETTQEEEFPYVGVFGPNTGSTVDLGPVPLQIVIPNTPGFYAIDDLAAPDPYNNALSIDGSPYLLAEVSDSFTANVSIDLFEYPGFHTTGFAADWVFQGDIALNVLGTTVSLGSYLPSGSGFLGIVNDQDKGLVQLDISGNGAFGMDNLYVGHVLPIPAAFWLLLAGLGGLATAANVRKNPRDGPA